MIELHGEIVWNSGMWHSKIYQRGDEFILSEQSEMMDEPSREHFRTLQEAVNAMFSHT